MGIGETQSQQRSRVDAVPVNPQTSPYLFGAHMYTSQVAAKTAAFIQCLGMKFAYRKHRFVLGSPPETESMEFWLPACNTFLFVYPDMPLVSQCKVHESVAKLGHNVSVLIGCVAPPVRIKASDPVNGWRGWTLEEFSAKLLPGWTSWIEDKGSVKLTQIHCPYDERCCTDRLKQMYKYADDHVSQDTDTDEDTADPVEGLSKTVGRLNVGSS